MGEQWKYCIDFLEESDGVLSYAVKWSVPTRRSPVPETTATVFFYLTSRAAVSAPPPQCQGVVA